VRRQGLLSEATPTPQAAERTRVGQPASDAMEIKELAFTPSEAVTIDDKSSPKEKERTRIRLRFSLFFDGTGNNRKNVQTRLDYEEQGHDPRGVYKRIDEADTWHGSSYFNDFSNVARLYKHAAKVSGYDHHFNIYTEGIGTLDDEEDSNYGNISGRGHWFETNTGVVAKVQKGLAKAFAELSEKYDPTTTTIELATIDTFGFSRGATAARHCVDRVLHSEEKKLSFKQELEMRGYEVEKVEVDVVGLYDTVSALGVAYIDTSDVSTLGLDAVRKAKAVYHLAAAEEYRWCFSLTNIDSAVSAGVGWQVFLPGAHSDVGGGYVNLNPEKKALWAGDGAEEVLEFLETRGWVKHDEARIIGRWDISTRRDDIAPEQPNDRGRKTKWTQAHLMTEDRYLRLEREMISNRYSYVPLHLMAAFCREQSLNISSRLESEYDPLKGPGPMPAALVSRIKAYAEKVKASNSSVAEDWMGGDSDLKRLRNKYLHFSSASSIGLDMRVLRFEDFFEPVRKIFSDA
jgi:hypothetical protein